MRRLAELARGFILPFFMGVALSLDAEHGEQDHHGKRQHPNPGVPRLVRAVHFDSYTITGSSFDVRSTRR